MKTTISTETVRVFLDEKGRGLVFTSPYPGDRGQLAALCEAVHLAIDPETEPAADTFRAAFLPAEDGQGEVLLTAPRHAGLPGPLLRAEACEELRRAGLYTDERADLIEIGYWTGRP